MTCTVALYLLMLTSLLQLTAIAMLFRYHRELRSQGLESGEAWKTLMRIALAMEKSVEDHSRRITDLEDGQRKVG